MWLWYGLRGYRTTQPLEDKEDMEVGTSKLGGSRHATARCKRRTVFAHSRACQRLARAQDYLLPGTKANCGGHAGRDGKSCFQKDFRAADLITRYGGDEFLVIMPDTDLVQAGVAVRRLQWWLERWNDSEQREYRLSLSCGVAEYKPGRTIEGVIQAADADLYVEKASRGTVGNASIERNLGTY